MYFIVSTNGNRYEIDQYNDRVVAYVSSSAYEAIHHLDSLQKQHSLGKVVIFTTSPLVDHFLQNGFILEGKVEGFFNGQQAYVISKFYKVARKFQTQSKEKEQILRTALTDTKKLTSIDVDPEYSIESLKEDEIDKLTVLYKNVFTRYPSNIFDPQYLKKMIGPDYIFTVVKYKGEIVCAASALINPYNSAEITDCATNPAHRGKNLLSFVIIELEKRLKAKKINHFYSLTRALSTGMNVTIKRLGYKYEGTLVKNCVISTGFEDMNIWTKSVRRT